MAKADEAFGLSGVAAIAGVLFSLSIWLAFAIARAGGGGLAASLLAGAVALVLSLVHLLPRPHVVTTVILAAETLVLTHYRLTGGARALLLLPLLFAAWANLHGGFPIGFTVLGVFLLDAWIGRISSHSRPDNPVVITAVAGAAITATLINPTGLALWTHVFEHLGNNFFMDITQEFQSPDFHAAYGKLLLVTIGSAAALVGWRRPRIRLYEGMLFLLGMAAALLSARHITVFAMISVPWIAVWLTRSVDEAAAHGSTFARRLTERGNRLAPVAAASGPWIPLLLGSVATALVLGPFRARAAFDPSQFPIDALEAVPPETMQGEIFNQMRWGGYLLYAYPDVKIFMDGHADFYGEALTRDYLEIRHLAPDWEAKLDRYDVSWTLTMPDAPITQALALSGEWQLEYRDETAAIYRRFDRPRRDGESR
jgi:hypothetical protein